MLRITVALLEAWWAAPASAGIILSDMQARFDSKTLTGGSTVVHLLAGGPFGDGGIAAGLHEPDDTRTVPPGPIRWVAFEDEVGGVDPSPFAPGVVSFNFDRTGDFSGTEPEPFKVFMTTATQTLGELDFSGVSCAMLGSLTGITGLALITAAGSVPIDPLDIRAVPEPGTLALFVFGLAGLGCAAWQRRRSMPLKPA